MNRSSILAIALPALIAEPVAAVGITAGPWCGALTPNSVVVTAVLDASSVKARLAVSTASTLSNPRYSPTVTSANASGKNVRLSLSGLTPSTTYFYALELNGTLQTGESQTGTFTTMPAPGPASFRFGFSACTDWEESGQHVFDAMRDEGLLFYIHTGDLNYQDTNSTSSSAYRSNYIDILTESPECGEFFRKVPVCYIWDDHDFAGNDSDRTSTGRSTHRKVYREIVPHYPLPAGGPDAAIYQAFDCGRVRFILTDLRSERDPDSASDNSSKSMMGASQKQWFKNQLVAARDGGVPLIVWMSSVPFLSNSTSSDNWGSYKTERLELLNFISTETIRNIIIISGDMHALAYDDGSGTAGYVDGVHIPVFHAAALTRRGSEKGGPYSGGVSKGKGRYATLDIADHGGPVSVTYRGRIASSSTSISTWKTYTHLVPPLHLEPATGAAAEPVLNAIDLTWIDPSSAETGFRIERSPASAGNWVDIGTVPANTTTYHDATIAPDTAYDYRVIALSGSIEAQPSNTATATSHDAFQNWKLLKLGHADAADSADDDHDGLTLMEEYLFDLNPNLPDRYLWSVSAPASGTGHVTVTFPTSLGRSYRVHYSHDLLDWPPGSPQTTGDGSPKQWVDDGTVTGSSPATLGRRFYRLVVTGTR